MKYLFRCATALALAASLLLVPVSAVNTSGDTKYILLAPSTAVLGEEYDEAED